MSNDLAPERSKEMSRKRYAISGLSARAIGSYILPLTGTINELNQSDFRDHGVIVGIMDIDEVRVASFCQKFGLSLPFYSAEKGIHEMIAQARPDVLIVAGPDHTHFEHIIAGLEGGLRVIAEKPVVINCAEIQAVIETEKESRGSLIAAHNYRYTPINLQLKRLLQSGVIGKITNVEFVYNLDTLHGPSYFQRWNRIREKSGGMTIHKSVHHLDLMNWLLESEPETVFGFGSLNYFGADGAHKPIGRNGEELPIHKMRERCPYFQQHYAGQRSPSAGRIVIGWDSYDLPYSAQYPDDAYIYDAEIDIEDTYSAVIRYRSGATMTFSCNFSTPWEGYKMAINGTLGRIEANCHTIPDEKGNQRASNKQQNIVLLPLFGGKKEYLITDGIGGHGGSDPLIQRDLFMEPAPESVKLALPAGSRDAAMAIAAGEAIWRSAKEGCPVEIRRLLPDSLLQG